MKTPFLLPLNPLPAFIQAQSLYELTNLYERMVGERAPMNSGELCDFMTFHYTQYPEELAQDFAAWRN